MTTIINNGAPLESLLPEIVIAKLNMRFFEEKGHKITQKMYDKHRGLMQKILRSQKPYLFYSYCKIPQTLHEFKVHKVDTDGLSKRKAAALRNKTYNLWKQWKTNYMQLHDLIREETHKETNDKVRKRRSYMANKQRQ